LIAGGIGLVAVVAMVAVVAWQTRDDSAAPQAAVLPAPVAAPAVSQAAPAAEPPALYVVSSQAAVEPTLVGLNEAESIRAQMGLSSGTADNASIAVATSQLEFEQILRATDEANLIRASEGRSPVQVVDLRGR